MHEEEKQMLLKLLNECNDSYKSTVFSQLEKDFKIHKIEEIYDRKIFEKLASRTKNDLIKKLNYPDFTKITDLDIVPYYLQKQSIKFENFEFEIRDVVNKLENEEERNFWIMIHAEMFSARQVYIDKCLDYFWQHKE